MKAQVSIEFIMIMIILIAALSIAAAASFLKTREIQSLTLESEVSQVLTEAGTAIHTVFLEGDGFSTNTTIPEKILSQDYNLSLTSNFLLLTIQNITFSRHLAVQNISGQFRKGENTLKNVNGEVRIL